MSELVEPTRISYFAGKKDILIHIGLLLFVSIMSYGLYLTTVGFHWDDINLMFVKYNYGEKALANFVSHDRPAMKLTYGFIPSIVGNSFVKWAILIMLEWWFCSILLFSFIKNLLPGLYQFAVWSSLLFVVFPAFNSMSLVVIYSMVFIQVLMLLISYNLMERYFHAPKFRVAYYIISVMLTFQVFLSEYWFGMEICRLFFIMILCAGKPDFKRIIDRKNVLRSIRIYLPYAAIILFFLIWRMFIYKGFRPDTDQDLIVGNIKSNFIGEMAVRFKFLMSDIVISGFFAWIHSFGHWFYDFDSGYLLKIWMVFILVFITLILFYAKGAEKKEEAEVVNKRKLSKIFIVIGLVIMIVSEIPVNFISLHIVLDSTLSRIAFSSFFGACFFVSGIIGQISHSKKSAIIIIAFLVAGGAAYQYRNGQLFSEEQKYHKDLFEQLSWRAPYIEKGTQLESEQLPGVSPNDHNFTLSGIICGMYGPSPNIEQQNYQMIKANVNDPIPFISGMSIKKAAYQFIRFNGNYDRSIALWKPAKGCLRVVDSTNMNWIDISPATSLAARISKTALIRTDVPSNVHHDYLEVLFNKPDTNCWCYYFEKAELARQSKDWPSVKDWLDKALALKLSPENDIEWITYLEACIYLKKYDEVSMTLKRFGNKFSQTYAYNCMKSINTRLTEPDKSVISNLMGKFVQGLQAKSENSYKKDAGIK